MTNENSTPKDLLGGRPESVQAAFEVFAGRPDTGPHATSMFRYIESLEATVSRFRSERSYVVGCNTGFEAAIEQAAAVVDDAAVSFEKQASTNADSQVHDAMMMASDALELTAGEIRALSAKEGE